MDPDATLPPPDRSLGDLPTLGYDGGPPAAGPADDGDAPDIPGYEVVRPLGRGGMGVVYLARQASLNRPVALKLLPVGRMGETVRRRFQAEAESAARVAHPGIVGVYEVGEHAGRPYFALEYCSGGSLADKLAGTPLTPRAAADLGERVARAVHAAHLAGVVHRDLKPDNVLFAADGTPKVADFGLAKPVQGDSRLTHDGAVLGTPSYMAPEQARGDGPAVGPRADVYALGAVLYECLTGRPPFRAATLLDTLSQVLGADPVSPRKLVPGLPRDLDTVTLKCLEKDPAKRYPTADAVADDLRAFLAGRPIAARPVGLPERAWKTLRRRPEIGLVAAVLVGAVAAVVGVLAASNSRLVRERTAAVGAKLDADAARLEAEAGRAEAEAQRRKADDRLAAAVEAVENMLGHTAAESWTLNPVLQDERRKLLEDAVSFYERLAAGDGGDPVVRRETARANLRAGRAWLNLGEVGKAEAACRKAAGLAGGLADARPDDTPAVALAAEATAFLGHALAIRGDYPAAGREYEAAAVRAERAADRPDGADAGLTAVHARTSLANLHAVTDAARATAEGDAAVARAGRLAAAPDAPPLHRLAHAEALVAAAVARRGTPAEAAEASRLLDRAEAALKAVPAAARGQGPAGRGRRGGELAEGLIRARGQLDIQRGAVQLVAARSPADLREAVRLLRAGLGSFDALLKAHPKSFPYRLSKFLTLEALGIAADRLGDPAGRDAAALDLDRLTAEIVRDFPAADWLLVRGAVPRTVRLLADVTAGRHDRFDADAADLLALADRLGGGGPAPVVRYNVACGHAQMVRHGPAADRERHAAAAVGLLAALADGGYFKVGRRAADLATDPDLDPLRDRADFRAVAGRVAPPPAGGGS